MSAGAGRWRRGARLGLVEGAALAALAVACGTDGNQPLPVRTTVQWLFDSYPDKGITEGDNCTDLGIDKVQVAVAGVEMQTMSGGCTDRQVVFQGLTPGAYTAALTPLDASGAALVKAPVQLAITAADHDTQVTINVPYDAWKTAYTGTYYFKLAWAGKDCAAALPPVDKQIITLSQGGVATTLTSDTGQKLDGSDPEACRSNAGAAQYVAKMPFGPATILIQGNSGGQVLYHQQFDTFVGAGLSNPTMTFDVGGPPDAMPPDAGVDAMPDA